MYSLRNQFFRSKDAKACEAQLRAFEVFGIFGHDDLGAARDGELHHVVVRLVR